MTDWLSAGIAPFAGLEWWVVAAVATIHLFGCFVRGAFGFGSNMPIVIMTTFLLGPHHAVVLALMTTLIAQTHLIPQGLKTADWPVVKTLFIGIILGTAFGTWIFTSLSPERLVLTLGFLIAAVIAFDSLKLVERLTRSVDLRSWQMTGGFSFIGGTLGGLSGAGAFYFLVVYLKHACETPTALRGTNMLLSGLTMIVRFAALSLAGLITPSIVTEGLLLTPLVFLGTFIGTHAFRRSTPKGFYLGLQILLFAGAVGLIAKGLGQL
tara:strand:- start:1590 stop:2387 length:798 start_codon:yes stop_codon:yes gene_type:complete